MEAITPDGPSDGDLVEIAFADSREEAEAIQGLLQGNDIPSLLKSATPHGPSLGIGLLPRSPQRVMVHAGQADAAHQLLVGILGEEAPDEMTAIEEPLLAEEEGDKKLRNYGVGGAYARASLWSTGAFALAFGVFLLLRLT